MKVSPRDNSPEGRAFTKGCFIGLGIFVGLFIAVQLCAILWLLSPR